MCPIRANTVYSTIAIRDIADATEQTRHYSNIVSAQLVATAATGTKG